MPWTLLLTLTVLIIAAVVIAQKFALPRNIWLLFLIQPLALSASPVVVFIGGILATELAPDPSLSTLPLTVLIIGLTCFTIPAALLAKRFGRKRAFNIGLLISFIGCLFAAWSAYAAHFYLFLLACLFLGGSMAFVAQLRFAAMDSVEHQQQLPQVVAILMFAGIFAAFIGPEVALLGKDWLPSPHGFAGSFLALAGLIIIAAVIFQAFTEPTLAEQHIEHTGRPLRAIIQQPYYIIALLSGAIGYGLMSLLMTATPISMHHMHGHSLQDTKWVIQSHIAAMYLPSLVTSLLVNRFGIDKLLIAGISMFSVVAVIALSGHQLLHYWWALLLLGVGWNFLFLTNTLLLPRSYQAHERHKVQASNDFIIFFVQASASLSAGWLLFQTDWSTLVLSSIPAIAIMALAATWLFHIERRLPPSS